MHEYFAFSSLQKINENYFYPQIVIPDEEQKETQISPIDSIKLSAIPIAEDDQSSSDSEELLETTATSSSSARLERIR